MTGLYRTPSTPARPLASRLRELRLAAALPGWKVAAAGSMDSGLLSKIENGRRAITRAQLAALAEFYRVEAAPLEALRLAEEIRRKHGDNPALAEATNILREDPGELPVNKMAAGANRTARAVSKSKKAV